MTSNPLLLAADASPSLLPLLRSNPALAHTQDESGYSLLHALVSYNHITLLRTINQEFKLDPGTFDNDGETALFVAETVEAAQFLVEELDIDAQHRNHEGQTAEEKIAEEGEFVVVSDYLRETRVRGSSTTGDGGGAVSEVEGVRPPPPLPEGVRMSIGTVQAGEEQALEPDQEFRRRIEELAAREDFADEAGQAQLRELVKDAVRDVGASERETRRRVD